MVFNSYSIGKGTGYKASALAGLDEGHTLVIGGKEIEVRTYVTFLVPAHHIDLVTSMTYLQ